MTAHELARLLLQAPDYRIVCCTWEVDDWGNEGYEEKDVDALYVQPAAGTITPCAEADHASTTFPGGSEYLMKYR